MTDIQSMACPNCQRSKAQDSKILTRRSSYSTSLTALTMHKLSAVIRSSISKVVMNHRTSTLSTSSSETLSTKRRSSLLSSSSTSQLWLFSMWLLLLLAVVNGQAQELTGHSEEEVALADHYLARFGYYGKQGLSLVEDVTSLADDVSTISPTVHSQATHSETERRQAIERLQSFFHLPVTGDLDKTTKQVITTARCGREDVKVDDDEEEVADTEEKDGVTGGKKRRKRYTIGKNFDGTPSKWTQSELTWRITKPSQQIPVSQQRSIMSKALAIWAQVVPIKFIEVSGNEHPDIEIKFVRGRHGDEHDPVFDGSPKNRENVLAHAWGPGARVKDLPGDAHFDDDDDWSDADTLLGVAVHELGHVMGLGHSDDDTAIMFPAYRDVTELGPDDIAGIEALYGRHGNRRIRPVTVRPRVRTQRPDTRYTIRPDIRPLTNRPTVRPDPRYRTRRPDPRYRTERPRYRTERPRYVTERPDPRYRTVRPDPRYRTERPDPRYRTVRPDPRYRTVRPDPRYRTVRPDPRYRTERPDIRYWTRRPTPRYRTERPDPRRTRGPHYTVKPEWVTPPPTTATPLDQCAAVKVDAVFEDPTTKLARIFFAISGEHVHTLTSRGNLIQSQPLNDMFPDLPGSPDAAFSIRETQRVYFIKDDHIWAYRRGQLEPGFPRSLHTHEFPETPKFAVNIPDSRGNTRLFLFGEQYWWRFDVERSRKVFYEPISDFSRNLPTDIMFASIWTDNRLYAVTEDSYVILDLERREVTHEKPLIGKPEWLRELCFNGSRSSASISMTCLIGMLAVVRLVKSVLMN